MKRAVFILAASLLALPLYAADRTQASMSDHQKADTIKVKGTIEAIDQSARTVTFRDKGGNAVTLRAGHDIQDFDDLNVGDKVTFRYTEPEVLRVHEADDGDKVYGSGDATGTAVNPPESESQPGVPTEEPGAPGGGAGAGAASPSGSTTGSASATPETADGTTTGSMTAFGTVKNVNTGDQTIRFETVDGRTVTAHADDPKLLDDLDRGDRIEITWSNPILLGIEK